MAEAFIRSTTVRSIKNIPSTPTFFITNQIKLFSSPRHDENSPIQQFLIFYFSFDARLTILSDYALARYIPVLGTHPEGKENKHK